MTICPDSKEKSIVERKIKNDTWERDLWFKVLGIKKRMKP